MQEQLGGPDPLTRSQHAPPARTLIDILWASAEEHPEATAIDDGKHPLSYRALLRQVSARAGELTAAGVLRGDKVGVRMSSGSADLYVAILAVLAAGAAYVPVDADDPPERARTVFTEASVAGVLTDGFRFTPGPPSGRGGRPTRPVPAARPVARGPVGSADPVPRPQVELDDDAWVIFTSGSTGAPKGVAVTHRSAAAFVDAEARVFLRDNPLGPGDRVLAGLSVAFDASCEEMWLAWRHGACLVPAPRALVRTGMDLGPWLVEQQITVISTVPTLAGLWRPRELAGVRMLIFGGEACPPELGARLAVDGREVWNTYGPTEATVVACLAPLTGQGPVRIGLPLDGWDLAVVDGSGARVGQGETGELVIGGVGLARYLDPVKDAEKYAPAPALGWERAYRSGDLVRNEAAGLIFVGRADDQVKVGGRRIELGELDTALQGLDGVGAAAAAVRKTPAGTAVLVGYLSPAPGVHLDLAAARRTLAEQLPAALVPLLTVVDEMPTRTSGKVDRDALPWPLDDGVDDAEVTIPGLTETGRWLAKEWTRALGTPVTGPGDDFFDSGGGSLSAAQLVSALRTRVPTITVADIYDNPTLGALADRLDEFDPPVEVGGRVVRPVPVRAQLIQTVLGVPLAGVVGLRWLTWAMLLSNVLAATGRVSWAPTVSWWWVLAGWLLLITPLGRMGLTVAVARATLRRIRPGSYPRGGSVHLRLWFAEAFAAAAGADNLAGAPWMTHYARALGARIGRDVDLHATPPVTGMLTLRRGCAIEPEVDLSGHWLDGDVVHIGRVRVDARARVGTRSVLAPGTRVGQGAEVSAGSAALGSVPPGELWTGSPAVFVGRAGPVGPDEAAPRGRSWVPVYAVTAAGLAALPLISVLCGLAVLGLGVRDTASSAQAWRGAAIWLVPSAVTMFVVLAVLILICVRLLSLGIVAGHHPVRSRIGWQIWTTERLMDEARNWLFPLYSSQATPTWLRALGARIAPNVEASTVLMLPSMTTVGEGAFLADDTMIGSYELGGGWLRVEPSTVGKRAFLGNSGMTAPGRRVPKHGLVAVLSAAPEGAKAGTSWLGSPPVKLRRAATEVDAARTFEPPKRLRMMRGIVEALRVVPVIGAAALGVAVLMSLIDVVARWGVGGGVLAATPVVLAASVCSAVVATVTKWLLVGRIKAGEHPLWSSFVWRSELADTFVETMTAVWFARLTFGTPALVWWLRSMGSRIGRGVWCETYWLPEADLVTIGQGASVNLGCVLQTHLFHDRVMSLDSVTLEAGATMGPHGVILPAAVVGAGTTIGPSALVLRGEQLPPGTRWTGNPIAPWVDEADE